MRLLVRFIIGAPFVIMASLLAWAFNDPDELHRVWSFVRYGREE